jgi:hypothetical protein
MRIANQFRSWPAGIAPLLVCAAAALCAGCTGNGTESGAEAQIADRWQPSASAQGGTPAQRYRTVFVVGVAHSGELRRMFEDELVRQLHGLGVTATASYTVLPQLSPARDEVVRAVRASGAEAVIVTRLLKREQWRRASLGASDYQTHYNEATQSVYVPQSPTVYRSEVVTLETRLFDAQRERMVWAATTELFDPRATAAQVARLVRAIVKDLQQATFI